MSNANDITEAPVRLLQHATRRGEYFTWQVVNCPYFSKKHSHGAGDDPAPVNSYLGHRVAHCLKPRSGRGGYQLVRIDGEARSWHRRPGLKILRQRKRRRERWPWRNISGRSLPIPINRQVEVQL